MPVPSAASTHLRDLVRTHRGAIAYIMERYGATNLRLFGSVARGDAHEASDVDFLVDLRAKSGNELLRVAGLSEELGELLGCRVDVVTPQLMRAAMSGTAQLDAVAV